MIMNFTSTTDIARKGSKIFEEYDEAIVLHNNKDIGLILGGKLAKAVIDSGLIQQIREEMYELEDIETINLIKKHKDGKETDEISLEDYVSKYGI